MSYTTLKIKPAKIVALCQHLMDQGTKYGLGSKIFPIDKMDGIAKVDCSGFSRWAIYHATKATGASVAIPGGSVNQHGWIIKQGFKPSTFDAGKLTDGLVRIAFLRPESSLSHIGHVVLIVNGYTAESAGKTGPRMIPWGSRPYHKLMDVYCLTLPVGGKG